MALWRFKRGLKEPGDTGRVEKGKKVIKRAAPVAMEVKLLAMEALEAGLSPQEVCAYHLIHPCNWFADG